MIEYRGWYILSHQGDHYHYAEVLDSQGRMVLPMNCGGPASQDERDYYGSAGCVPTIEDAQRAIDTEQETQ